MLAAAGLLSGLRGRRAVLPGLRRAWHWLARRRAAACIAVGLLAGGLAAGLGAWRGIPPPVVTDEWSHLLAADTFCQFRLTNPTHPYWMHFQSEEVIHRPSYQSKYPPGQGLFLALGRALGGQPIVGVWLSLALACTATCWMLQAFVPPRWALLGGVLAAISPSILTMWGCTYLGGPPAMLGGALAVGATRRLVRQPRPLWGCLLGGGLFVMANTRPFEGLVVALPLGAVLLHWLARRRGKALGAAVRCGVLPLALVLAAGAAWMAWYNYRVTGEPLRMPYQVWAKTYGIGTQKRSLEWMLFPWVREHPPGLPDLARAFVKRLLEQWAFYVRVPLTLALLPLVRALARRWLWLPLTAWLLLLATMAGQYTRGYPHYTAPAASLVFLAVVEGLRQWSAACRRSGFGTWLASLTAPLCLCALACFLAGWEPTAQRKLDRARAVVEPYITRLPGKHLVFVDYGKRQQVAFEWVYNGADIDAGRIVWAHRLGRRRDRALRRYYTDRSAWVLDASHWPPLLSPYVEATGGGAPASGSTAAPSAGLRSVAPPGN
jgi:hypothetical protein